MVFCGRPSKACQRCRDRKLRCDLASGSCGQCVRAARVCTGYRDTQQLRIRNESEAVQRKAQLRNGCIFDPSSRILSLDYQARDTFFAHYVTGTSKAWDFLQPFHDAKNSPEHLTLSIDAVSLAYLSHQLSSNAALMTARERYGSALRMTNKALQCPETAAKETTLFSSLLLDLFEKITNEQPGNDQSLVGHVNGALALVRLRGFDEFQNPSALRVLVRLSTNLLISCVASATQVPEQLSTLRDHVSCFLDVTDPKWRLSSLMFYYANLRSNVRRGDSSMANCLDKSMELDARLQALTLDMPTSWRYKTRSVERQSERTFDHYFDVYPDRHVTQTWNVLRLVRILLNEFVYETCSEASGYAERYDWQLSRTAVGNIARLASDICASVPQYVDCDPEARGRLSDPVDLTLPAPTDVKSDTPGHLHSPSQNLDCYTLIYPLYVAGRSKGSPDAVRLWVIEQLHYIGNHFGMRNAELVSRILERRADIDPWTVYAMLGSYAFAA